MPTIGDLLRRWREDADYTQKQAAKKAGISPRSLSDYENGQTDPKWGHVLKLRDIYGMSTSIDHITEELRTPFTDPNSNVDYEVVVAGDSGKKMTFDRRILERAGVEPEANHFVVQMAGSSMSPWIEPDEYILATRTREVEDGDFYTFRMQHRDTPLIRYIERTVAGLLISSYGPNPKTDEYKHVGKDLYKTEDGTEVDITIIGRLSRTLSRPTTAPSILSVVSNQIARAFGTNGTHE